MIYRFQVLKQADVVLALFLQGDQFTPEEKRADFEYYDPITTGDSTLSAVVQSIIAAEVGYHDLALRYFLASLFVDLADLHDNTADGVHVASTGGVWSALVFGFGGMRDHGGRRVKFDPRLPDGWEALGVPADPARHAGPGPRPPRRARADHRGRPRAAGVHGARRAGRGDDRGEGTRGGPRRSGPAHRGRAASPVGTRRADGTLIAATVPSGDGRSRHRPRAT